MGKLKKSLDKFDVVTPLLVGAGGGTADYGEADKRKQRQMNADAVGLITEEDTGKRVQSNEPRKQRPRKKVVGKPTRTRHSLNEGY